MARYAIDNNRAFSVSVPEPIARTLKPRERLVIEVPAALLDVPAIQEAIDHDLITVTPLASLTASAIEVAPADSPDIVSSSDREILAGEGLVGGGDLSADRTLDIANSDGSILIEADEISVGVLATDAQHGTRGGGTQHAVATTLAAGFMSTADKAILNNLSSGVATLAYAGSVAIDFASSLETFKTIALTGDVTLTSSNLAAGRMVFVRIVADGTNRTVTMPGGWVFLEADAPFVVQANKTALLQLISFSTTDANVVARFAVSP